MYVLWDIKSRDGDSSSGDGVESLALGCPSEEKEQTLTVDLGSGLYRLSGEKAGVPEDDGEEELLVIALLDGPLKIPTSGTNVVAWTLLTPSGLLYRVS